MERLRKLPAGLTVRSTNGRRYSVLSQIDRDTLLQDQGEGAAGWVVAWGILTDGEHRPGEFEEAMAEGGPGGYEPPYVSWDQGHYFDDGGKATKFLLGRNQAGAALETPEELGKRYLDFYGKDDAPRKFLERMAEEGYETDFIVQVADCFFEEAGSDEIIMCSVCKKFSLKDGMEGHPEYWVCEGCGEWFCGNCIDIDADSDIVLCGECAEKDMGGAEERGWLPETIFDVIRHRRENRAVKEWGGPVKAMTAFILRRFTDRELKFFASADGCADRQMLYDIAFSLLHWRDAMDIYTKIEGSEKDRGHEKAQAEIQQLKAELYDLLKKKS